MRQMIGCFSLLLMIGCGSTTQTKKQTSKTTEEPKPLTKAPEVAKPEAFCPQGADEYKRKAYRWCKKDGVLHGKFQVLAQSVVMMEGTFKAGQMDGKWVGYWSNNTPRWQVNYQSGKESGAVEGWYADGKKHYEIEYKDGKRDGTSTYWYPNGQKSSQLAFGAGVPKGQWTYWHDNGQKAHAFSWMGKGKESIHKHWTKAGKKTHSPNGRMSKRMVTPMLETLANRVVNCYKHSRLVSKTAGKLVAQFSIDYMGDVSLMNLIETNFDHPFMGQCARRQLESLRFPENPYGRLAIIRSWELNVQ